MQNKKLTIILTILIIVAAGILILYFAYPDTLKLITQKISIEKEKPRIIEENLIIPETEKIANTEGRFVAENNIQVPIVPKNEGEKIIVPKAVLTLKQSYDSALSEVQKWAMDQKLVFIKSLGALTLEGKSSQWQLVFSSQTKKTKGYEIIIQSDQIVSKKEINSTAVGANLPTNWKDLGEVIKELQSHPLYQNATVSAVSFHINPDNKKWYYGLSTSKGASSIAVE